ncbi:GSCFA domain-containing protein [Methylobacterium sp. 77]|uniref:GSCFA domain-containing protein n=1 Tax=Methylobacterium sp. 77 TaxID=1101192 RepID=UPI001FD8F1BB|nr:GSCFA domain-containing protein [Methylobacterium sp. 77]
MTRKTSDSYFRGENPKFYPTDTSLQRDDVVPEYLVKGLMPVRPFIDKGASIVAFGSCFAAYVADYLHDAGYNVTSKQRSKAYVTQMADGIVHTHAIRQQFEWAWLNRVPEQPIWHGYKAEDFGYDDEARIATKQLFDGADVFIITFGLSEIWYDEVTGEVFWRAPPREVFDRERHKFRVSEFGERLDNIRAIYALIRHFRPSAAIVFTLSPVALTATFRPIACEVASSVSKAILRAAIDQHYREIKPNDDKLFYFPSYEIVTNDFLNPFRSDRRHVRLQVIDLNMKIFENYFCYNEFSSDFVVNTFRSALADDKRVASGNAAWDEIEQGTLNEIKDRRRALRAELRAAEAEQRRSERIREREAKRQGKAL